MTNQTLINQITSVVKANGAQGITGTNLQGVLVEMVQALGAFSAFAGMATPSTTPTTSDANVFYLAYEAGEYSGFGVTLDGTTYNIIRRTSQGWEALNTNIKTGEAIASAIVEALMPYDSELDENSAKITELEQELIGEAIAINMTTSLTYTILSHTNYVLTLMTSVNPSQCVAFYEIEQGKTYRIQIPRNVPYYYAYGFTNTLQTEAITDSTIIGGVGLGYEQSTMAIDAENTNTDNYSYLVVCYDVRGGEPSVYNITDGIIDNKIAQAKDALTTIINNEVNRATDAEGLLDGKISRIDAVICYESNIADASQVNALLSHTSGETTLKITENPSLLVYFYPVEQGKTYRIHIPRVYGYNYAYGFTNTLRTEAIAENTNIGGIVTGYSEYNYTLDKEITISDNYSYLVVGCDVRGGEPLLYEVVKGIADNVDDIDYDVISKGNKTLSYEVTDGQIIASTTMVGGTVRWSTSESYSYIKIDVRDLNGLVYISYVKLGGVPLVVTDNNGIVLKVFTQLYDYGRGFVIDLSDIPTSNYIYCNIFNDNHPSVNFVDYSLQSKSDAIPNLTSSIGTILLHFDGIDGETTTWRHRADLVAEYGFKCSFCLIPTMFTNNFTQWASDDIKNEYWDLVAKGYDFAYYPAQRCDSKNEEGWNTYIQNVLTGLKSLGIYNITTWACGNMSINDDLYNAVKNNGFKIIRGGGTGEDNAYVYTLEERFHNQLPTEQTYIVDNSSFVNDGENNIKRAKDVIDIAANSKTAASLFTHSVLDGNTNSNNLDTTNMRDILQYIKDLSDVGKLNVKTWREWYASVNKQDGYEQDYNRIMNMILNSNA